METGEGWHQGQKMSFSLLDSIKTFATVNFTEQRCTEISNQGKGIGGNRRKEMTKL
jgi:hypothetical protein